MMKTKKSVPFVAPVANRARLPLAAETELTITAIGARGDGMADGTGGERVFVPLTVPGDRVRVRLGPPQADGRRGQVVAWLARGAQAAQPVCRHFGRCGGCTLQHLASPAYLEWKCAQVASVVARAGFALDQPLELARTYPGGRRRASFIATRQGARVRLGFRERLSHQVVEIEECPILAPALVDVLPILRESLGEVLPQRASVEVSATCLDDGIDLLLCGALRLDLATRQALADLAQKADLPRLSWRAHDRGPIEPVAARRLAYVRMGGMVVEVPPGGFLQASAEGEAALVRAVCAAVAKAPSGPVADLFAGCGTFSLPLAAFGRRRVHAIDDHALGLAALTRAARPMSGLISSERRDLSRHPLTVEELASYTAVVFDPPRAGAVAQAEQLAASAVPLVVAVSCNPATFARDARILGQGGFRLLSGLVVDQFLWSAHVELVAVFERCDGALIYTSAPKA